MPEVVNVGVKAKPKPLSRVVTRVARLVGFAFWVFLVAKLFFFDIDSYVVNRIDPTLVWLLEYRWIGFLGLLFLGAVLSRTRNGRNFVFQVVLFPLIALAWLLPSVLVRNWAMVIAFAPMLQELVANLRGVILWYCLAIASAVLILACGNTYVLTGASVFLGIFLSRHYIREFRKTFQPSSVFADLASLVRSSRAALVRMVYSGGLDKLCSEKHEGLLAKDDLLHHKAALQAAYVVQSGLLLAAEKFRDVARSRKLDLYFIASLTYTFLLTIVCFSFAYFSLYKINPAYFSPNELLGYFDFLGFSFCMTTRAPLTSVLAVSAESRAVGYLHAIVLFVYAAIVVNFLLASARARYKEDLDQVIDELKQGADEIAAKMNSDFRLTYDDIEALIVEESRSMVNWLRSARGLPLLTPAASSASSIVQKQIESGK